MQFYYRTPELLWDWRSPRPSGHQLPTGGEGRVQWSSVQLQDHLSNHRGKRALCSCASLSESVEIIWLDVPVNPLSSDENSARLHLGGVCALCRPSHHPPRSVSQTAAGVHHAWAQPALPALGLELPEGPGHPAEAGWTRGERSRRSETLKHCGCNQRALFSQTLKG